MSIKFIELFAGIGGFRYGLEAVHDLHEAEEHEHEKKDSTSGGQRGVESKSADGLGRFNCVYANEFNKYATQIYEERFKDEIDTRDIREVKAEEIPDHELLTAGFPCQAFSIAGRRGGFEDTRGTLFFEIARIAKQKQPRLLLLENVKGLLSHDKGKTFGTILNTLDELGYDCQWQVLNSKDFGVPQNRERVFIVGHLRGTSRPEVFPITQSSESHLKYSGGVISAREQWLKDGKHNSRNFSQGQRIYSKEGISQTLAGNAGGQGGKTGLYDTGEMKIRRLTPTECERLQGFPDGWTEGISDTQRYKCLGNAVTTNVVTAIGERLKESK